MAEITRESNRVGSLLASTNRVEAPFVKVTINNYSFGVFERKGVKVDPRNGVITELAAKYPNYIQSLNVKKINGTVNQYSLKITYQITEDNDPNFFEKIFGSIADSFKITFTYGDAMLPEYIYRNEEAIITGIDSNIDINNASITYTIKAVSSSSLSLSGTYTFPSVTTKPSDKIKEVLWSSKYHLTDVFKGMRDRSLVEQMSFIASDDKIVKIPTCANMSILEYIAFLVSYMSPTGSTNTSAIKQNVYSLMTYEDTQEQYGGPYFKVQKVQKAQSTLNQLCTYAVDIGYPSSNIVTNFSIEENKNWSLFYKYNRDLGNSDYLTRINTNGEMEKIYSPQLTNTHFEMHQNDSTWWTKVTQYPITASMTLKGLLKPAILMQYVKINVWYYGKLHVSSGYYLITSQEDIIDVSSGYKTTLKLLRVAGAEEIS